MNVTSPARDETQLNRGSWLVLLIAVLFIAAGIFTITYRYVLPTDGWSYQYGVPGQVAVLDANLAGDRSELRTGDSLQTVNGIPIEQLMNDVYRPTPPEWRIGGKMTYTVMRDGQLVPIAVPVVAWTPGALWHSLTIDTGTLAGDVGMLIMLAAALFAFLRRPGNTAARMLLLIATIMTAEVLNGLLPSGVSTQFDTLAFFTITVWTQVLASAFAPLVLAFTWIFPRPKAFALRHTWLAWLLLAWAVALQVGMMLGFIGQAAWFIMLFTLILSIASMVHSLLTMRDAVSRAQIRWALGGFGLGMGSLLVTFLIGTLGLLGDPFFRAVQSITSGLAFPIIGASLTMAILRYRLFDIDVIIRRTAVYALLTALLASIYFGGVVVLQQVFVAISGQRSELAIILSTLAIAALFGPLRNGIQTVIDRRFFRRKFDAQKALAAFGLITRDEVDVSQLTVHLLEFVDETVQPARIALWLAAETIGHPRSAVITDTKSIQADEAVGNHAA